MSAARSSLDDALAEAVIVVEAAFGICARHRCALWQNKQPALFLCFAHCPAAGARCRRLGGGTSEAYQIVSVYITYCPLCDITCLLQPLLILTPRRACSQVEGRVVHALLAA